MKDQELIRVSQGILSAVIAIGAIVAVIHMIEPFLLDGLFETYTGQSWDDLVNQQPRQASLYVYLIKVAHCWYLGGTLCALYILCTSYGRGERAAWRVLLLATILGNGVPIVFGKIFSHPTGTAIGTAGLIACLVGLCIGAIPRWTCDEVHRM